MSITRIPSHDEYEIHETPLGVTDSAADVLTNIGKAVEIEPVIDQGPTKPLRLSWKERLRLIAQAIGFKTTLILLFVTLAALTLAVTQAAAVEP